MGIETRFKKEERVKEVTGNLIQYASWGKGVWVLQADYDKMRAEASLFFSRSPQGASLTYLQVVSGELYLNSYFVTVLFIIFHDHFGSLVPEQCHTCKTKHRSAIKCL